MCCTELRHVAEDTDNIGRYETIARDKALFKNRLVWMHFPAVADVMMINSLYHSEVGAQWSKPKHNRGSSRVRCQRLSQAPGSNTHFLLVCLEIPSMFWERDVTQHCSILSFFKGFPEIKSHQKISTFDIDSDIYKSRCVFKNRSICLVINHLILARGTSAFGQENWSTVLHQQTASVF